MVAFLRTLTKPGRRRRERLAQVALAALGLAALLPATARAQIGSYRYSSIVVDDATATSPKPSTPTPSAIPPASPS